MSNYLREGNLVTLNKDLPNKPLMMVYEIKRDKSQEGGPFKQLIGIECLWFTTEMQVQKEIFNFKDLEIIEQEEEDYD